MNRHISPKRVLGLLIALLVFSPTGAFAAGEADVQLKFSQQDQVFLLASIVFGLIALLAGWLLARQVLAQSPGSEKMQEVGKAIKEGALAYLRRQVMTMSIFVILLAIVIGALFGQMYGDVTKGAITAICFILGVAASYIAGYTGMILAVEGNMRTANAALTSYAKSLQVAFRSGAVAGLITVGMGLIGATLILYFGKSEAMKYLIGFGFGGSLAALFMRVGGGIFTKAADVGADLVGKVEAGIPEDDPRNPAVIADNVGDNVGDCAGMAADVFESYEVTLVAAIVLGAATATIFDQTTWMKLIMFALLARGIGIIASIIGILSVKGSDDIDSDPLKAIRKGFVSSALIAAVFTCGLAYWLMGGMGAPIQTNSFVTTEQADSKDLEKLRTAKALIIAERGKEEKRTIRDWEISAEEVVIHWAAINVREEIRKTKGATAAVSADDVLKDKRFDYLLDQMRMKNSDPKKIIERAFRINFPNFAKEEGDIYTLASRLNAPVETKPKVLAGFTPVDFKDKESPIQGLTVSVVPPDQPTGTPVSKTFIESNVVPGPNNTMVLGGTYTDPNDTSTPKKTEKLPYELFLLRVTPGNVPPEQAHMARPREVFYGPAFRKSLDDQLKAIPADTKVEVLAKYPINLYMNAEKEMVLGVNPIGIAFAKDGKTEDKNATAKKITALNPLFGSANLTYFTEDLKVMQDLDKRRANSQAPVAAPPAKTIQLAVVEQKPVEWWRFALAICFGIAMAFAIEMLTDYYVSTHKKPVQEVAGVATAGPAPMIISGFALAQESSVFSVIAIVVALIMPLQIFPAADYGGFILSFYGIALVGLGLLTTTGYILAMDTFGPISDNAQGVFEMSGAGHNNEAGSKAVQRLDAAGNTTKALTKGFAIATAVVAAVALFHSYIESAKLTGIGLPLDMPKIFLGMMVGGAAPYLFSAFSINAVGRAAFELINEVRRQFRNDAGIMAGTSKPDYGACVSIVTRAAQTELIGPGVLAIFLPLAVAFGFSIGEQPVKIGDGMYVLQGAQALGGFLAGTILSGQLMAVLLANAGGIWDNAKKVIEDGMHGGKGTEAHKAGVVCDTVGDPFKDTAGPALNPLIKVMNLVALLLAPVVIMPHGDMINSVVTVFCLAALAFSIWWSKRSSMTTAMVAAVSGDAAALPGDSTTHTPPKKKLTVEDEGDSTKLD